MDYTQSSLGPRVARRTYLITYSQINKDIFPSRESFGNCVSEYFDSGSGKVQVEHWVVCKENHKDGGEHYHMAIKLSGPKRWLSVKNKIYNNHGVSVHFSESHDNYYSAYKYLLKTDNNVFKSSNHPNLDEIGSPVTKKCIQTYRNKRKSINSEKHKYADTVVDNGACKEKKSKNRKIMSLSNLEVADFLLTHKIRTSKQLFAVANEQKNEGKKELANFVLSRSSKCLNELIENAWQMQSAEYEIQRAKKSRIELLRECGDGDCVEGCNGLWLKCAFEVLNNNYVHPIGFAAAVRNLLINGRGKFRNIMIIGPANCGKTFMLAPLQIVYNTFSNPANDKYAWIGVEKSEVIFLNDFRWSNELISWSAFL